MSYINQIIRTLKQNGITIQRYDADSRSIYLKLDYGVLNSLRISNHEGRTKLKYRYNLRSDLTTSRYDKETKQFFFPSSDVSGLLRQILSDHNDRRTRYGDEYESYMQSNLADNGHKRGFWSTAQVV